MKTQVDSKHYRFDNYLNMERWCSYFQQIKECMNREGMNEIMVVGLGDYIVPLVLKHLNNSANLTLVDYAEDLHPDICCNILELSHYYSGGGQDIVLCCQVLEHLEFDYFEKALCEILNVLKDEGVLILSLPDNGICFKVNMKLPKFNINIEKKFCRFYKKGYEFKGEHYWEINSARKYSAKKVRNLIQSHFFIMNEYVVRFNSYHRFYVCKAL